MTTLRYRWLALPILVAALTIASFQDASLGRTRLAAALAGSAWVVLAWVLQRLRPHPVWPLLMCLAPVELAWFDAAVTAPIALAGTIIAAARVLPERPAAIAATATMTAYQLVLALRTQHVAPLSVLYAYVGFGAVFTLVVATNRIREEQQRTRTALEELRASREAQVEAARGAERVRLAREMHDVLGHTLSALSVQLEGARLLLERERAAPAAVEAVARAHRLAREGLEEARRAVGTLRGDDLPGPDALPALVEGFERESSAPVRLRVDGDPVALAPDARLALYRTAQEALTNVRRHARPSQVDIRLRWERAGAELTVENDGAEDGEPGPAARRSAGYGLTGMRERAELLGGSLEVGGAGGRFRVRLWVPAALTSG